MTVFLPKHGKTWRYDFWFDGARYTGNTKQLTQSDAELAEREIRLKLRRDAGGIAQFFPDATPTFDEWARVFLVQKAKRLTRPDHMQAVVPVLLEFFGSEEGHRKILRQLKRPEQLEPTTRARRPYHALRLGHVIADPSWLMKFESWLVARGLGAQSRNHYRGFVRRMYALAMKPEHRQMTGVTLNPMVGVENDQTFERTITVSPADLRKWIAAASYHVRLALAIGALTPKLRLRNILDLQWAQHFEPDPRGTKFSDRVAHYITVQQHKTARRTRRPLTTPIPRDLLAILKDAHQRHPSSAHVVVYRGQPVRSIRGGVQAAAREAKLTYGRDVAGVTFHTLRHTAATLLAELMDNPLRWMEATGHRDMPTALKYRHRRPKRERPALDRLSKQLDLTQLVIAPRRRAHRAKAVLGKVQDSKTGTRQNPSKTAAS